MAEMRGKDLTGMRSGLLVVIGYDGYRNGKHWWRVRCDCGNEKSVTRENLCRSDRPVRSCGCLRHRRVFYSRERVVMTDEQKIWMIRHFKHTKNEVICQRFGWSHGTMHRFARDLGLKKSGQFMKKCVDEATAASVRSHLENGTYPPKGYVIPRSEEFRIKKGEHRKETKKQREERIRKAAATTAAIRKLERGRVLFGLEQRTKLKVRKSPGRVLSLRYNLKKRGYIIERGSIVAFYDENTQRSMVIENRKRGDRGYCYFEFKPLNANIL